MRALPMASSLSSAPTYVDTSVSTLWPSRRAVSPRGTPAAATWWRLRGGSRTRAAWAGRPARARGATRGSSSTCSVGYRCWSGTAGHPRRSARGARPTRPAAQPASAGSGQSGDRSWARRVRRSRCRPRSRPGAPTPPRATRAIPSGPSRSPTAAARRSTPPTSSRGTAGWPAGG